MATSNPTPSAAERPSGEDEFGLYDPKQAGMAALFTRLSREAESKAGAPPQEAKVRVLAEGPLPTRYSR